MFNVGTVCVKLAGRDAGKKCVVVEVLENNYVLVDGETRRRKCNTIHLEPTLQTLDISPGASHDHVIKAFTSSGVTTRETKPRAKMTRPPAVRKSATKVKTPTKAKKAKK